MWRAAPGRRSGISWHYLALLTGRDDVKPDRMIVRFVTAAIGRRPTAAEAAELVRSAAARLHVDARMLDHRIWEYTRGPNPRPTPGDEPGGERREIERFREQVAEAKT